MKVADVIGVAWQPVSFQLRASALLGGAKLPVWVAIY